MVMTFPRKKKNPNWTVLPENSKATQGITVSPSQDPALPAGTSAGTKKVGLKCENPYDPLIYPCLEWNMGGQREKLHK